MDGLVATGPLRVFFDLPDPRAANIRYRLIDLLAIDGKSIRRSFEHVWDKSGMAHMVSLFGQANGRVLR